MHLDTEAPWCQRRLALDLMEIMVGGWQPLGGSESELARGGRIESSFLVRLFDFPPSSWSHFLDQSCSSLDVCE